MLDSTTGKPLFLKGYNSLKKVYTLLCSDMETSSSDWRNGHPSKTIGVDVNAVLTWSMENGMNENESHIAMIAMVETCETPIYNYLTNKDNWQEVDDDDDDDTKNTDVDLSPDKVSDVQDYVDKDLASDNFRDTKEAQLSDLMLRYGKIKYSDQDISGVIYAWGNINADIGKNSTLNLTGAMVAYGGNPKEKTPGKNNKGKININAGTIGMTLDPDYMGVFLAANAKRKVKQVMFSNFQILLSNP